MKKPTRHLLISPARCITVAGAAVLTAGVWVGAFAAWSSADVVGRLSEQAATTSFDLGAGEPCGGGYEYHLASTHANFAALNKLIILSAEADIPVQVEYSGSGCAKTVNNVTQP